MTYREPGVYTSIINSRPNTGYTPELLPAIIGEGPAFVDFEEIAVTRSSTGLDDTLPSSKVTAIVSVYTISGGVKSVIVATGNYSLVAPNVIRWVTDGPGKPANAATYYVDYEARPETTQYLPKLITSYEELDTYYFGQLMKATTGGAYTTVNPVYMGAYLALESGAPGVYAIQVEPADKTDYAVVIATDMVTTLAQVELLEDAYFLVPMTSDSTAVGAVITHCTTMSATLERKERVCFVNKGITTPAAATGIFTSAELTTAKGLVSSIDDKRVRVPFITTATKILSDGTLHSLTADYVCAALAGLAATIPVHRALTRQKLYNFVELKNVVKVSRGWKNELAQEGYMIIEQPGGSGAPVVVRHGNTTKMDNVADKEHSIVAVVDYTSKYLRNCLESYIGVYNVDNILVTKVKGTVLICRSTLIKAENIIDLILTDIRQDADNPDTLAISVAVKPPYPCNYIDVTIVVE